MRLTERPVVIFDFDGVVTKNPRSALDGTNTDSNMWHNHWVNVADLEYNEDMVHMLRALYYSEHTIVILTARPIRYAEATLAALARIGFENVQEWLRDVENPTFYGAFGPHEMLGRVVLKMLDTTAVPAHSGEWKAEVVKSMVEAGLNVQFMVEDYKLNADAIRQHIPVLLYERKK